MPIPVSVILPIFNGEKYVEDAVRQLKNQTFEKFEVVVIDDASTDSTVSALRAAIGGDPRFRVLESQEPAGVAAARNRAIGECQGEYVWFADCDDYWSKDLLEQAHRRISRDGADLCLFRARRVDEERREIRKIPYEYSPAAAGPRELVGRFLAGTVHGFLWDKIVRRDLLRAGQFPAIRAFSDSGGMIDLLCRARSAVFCDSYLYEYVRREGSISTAGAQDVDNLLRLSGIIRSSLEEHGLYGEFEAAYARYHARMLTGSVKLALRSDASAETISAKLAASRRALRELPAPRGGRSAREASRSAEIWLLKSFPGAYSALYRGYRKIAGKR